MRTRGSSSPVLHTMVAVVMAGGVAGCDARTRPTAVTPASQISDGTASVALEPVQSMGPAPLSSWVRAVNSYGAAVPSDPQRVSVNGVGSLVGFDGVGYGAVTLDTVGVQQVTSDTVGVSSYVLPGWYEPPGVLPSAPAVIPTPELAATVTTGTLAVDGTEVWWVDPQGQRPHRVLSLSENILGLRVGSIDVDGVDDALVWTATAVYILRGRPDGGMAWGGGFVARGYGVGGADIGDLSADNLPDIGIAWIGGELGGVFDVWNGDGLFGFEAAEPRNISGRPVSAAIADNTGEGRPQATVMLANGTWVRFIEGAPARYMPIGPETPQSVLLSGGSVLGNRVDIDGDGAAEIPVYAPRIAGQSRPLHLFGVDEGVLILAYDNEVAAFTAPGDGDGDLVDDLWVHQETGELQVLYNEGRGATATYPRATLFRQTPSHGPIAVRDLDGDETNDLWLGGEHVWWWYRGRNFPGDPERFWELQPPERVFVREALQQTVRPVELDADPATHEMLVYQNDGRQLLSLLEDRGGERAERIGYAELNGTPVDLAVCGQRAYALMSGALYSVDLANRELLGVTASLPVTEPRDITCGTGPGGATAAVLDGDTLILLSATLGEVSRSQSPDAYGAAFVDYGTGPDVKVCRGEGCAIVGWSLSSGEARTVVGDAAGVRAFAADDSFVVLGGRADELYLQDIDGDGRDELLTLDGDTGLVGLYRDLGPAISPPQLWQVPLGWRGGILTYDGDRDGVIDLWGIDEETDGLRYLVAEVPEVTTTDSGHTASTGDTGLPTPTAQTAATGGATGAHTGAATAPTGSPGTGATGDTGP